MKSNREIREEAWQLLWKGKWFGRLLVAGLVLTIILFAVILGLDFVYRHLGVPSLADFQRAKLEAAASGLGFTSPSSEATMRMWSASCFQTFIHHLFAGITMIGYSMLLLKAVRGDGKDWFKSAFVGYLRPFAMFWLWFRVQLLVALWMIGVLLPSMIVGGIVMQVAKLPVVPVSAVCSIPAAVVIIWLLYRYRLVWLLKVDHLDWRAGECIRKSIALMNGMKNRAISLDFSYWLWFVLMIPVLAPNFAFGYVMANGSLGRLTPFQLAAGSVSFAFSVTLGMVVYWYIALGHAIFYRDLVAEKLAGGERLAG